MSCSRLPAMRSRSSVLSRVQRALALSWYSAQFFSMSVQSILEARYAAPGTGPCAKPLPRLDARRKAATSRRRFMVHHTRAGAPREPLFFSRRAHQARAAGSLAKEESAGSEGRQSSGSSNRRSGEAAQAEGELHLLSPQSLYESFLLDH